MSYVPEDQRTTAWYLFEPKFMCRVPQIAMRSVDDLKQFGVFSTGDSMIDREMSKEPTVRYLSIAQMEDIYHRGHSIRVVNYDQTKTIYEYISNHLINWRTFFETVENNRVDQATVEELIRLDKFAAEVYKPAKHLFTREIAQSVLGRLLQTRRTARLLRSAFNEVPEMTPTSGGPRSPNDVPKPAAPSLFPERVSLSQIFERQKNDSAASVRQQAGL